MKKILIYIISLLFVDVYSIDFRHITTDDGLKSNYIFSIAQDSSHQMWFGGLNTISRFNGNIIRNYRLFPEYKNANKGLSIRTYSVTRDSNDNIWAGTSQGLFRFNAKKDRFNYIKISDRQNISGEDINVIKEDKGKGFWIGTFYKLKYFDFKTKKARTIGYMKGSIFSLLINKNEIFTGGSKGLFRYNTENEKFIPISKNPVISKKLRSIFIYSINRDKRGNIWIGTQKSGVFILNSNFSHLTSLNKKINYNIRNAVRDIEFTKSGEVNIAIDGLGIMILDKYHNLKDIYQADENNPEAINNNGVYDIHYDVHGRMWIATYGGGVNMYDPVRKPFKKIQHNLNVTNSLMNNTGRSVIESSNGELWFGTKKGVSVYNKSNNKWRHISQNTNNKFSSDIVLALSEDKNGNIWIGTFGGGVTVYNLKSKKFRYYKYSESDTQGLSTNYIYRIYTDSSNNIWLSGIRGNICRYNPDNDNFTQFQLNNVFSIIEKDSDTMLVGSNHGLYSLDVNSGKLKKYNIEINGKTYKINNTVYCIYRDKNENIWVGTENNGLYVFNEKKGLYKQLNENTGLPSNSICSIIEDDNNSVWIGTSNGLVSVKNSTKDIEVFDKSDGITSNDFLRNSCYKTKDGKLIFGSQNGYTMFNPAKITSNPHPPKLSLTGFRINNLKVPISKNGILNNHINYTDEIRLQHNENAITIDFEAISYTGISKSRYKWMLKGFEKKWSNPQKRSSAIYTNIPPGRYTFMVTASNSDNVWCVSPRKINIIIDPPFWRTNFAYLIYLIVFILLFLLTRKYVLLYFYGKTSAEKIDFFMTIAHDIRTPLSLIKSPVNDLSEKKEYNEDEKNSFSIIKRNIERLNNLVTQLMDFQKADLNKLKLQVEPNVIYNHIKLAVDNFTPLIDRKNITVNINCNNKGQEVWYDKNKFSKVFYNLLSNAIKYSYDNSYITVDTNIENKYCHISFTDNGRGIPQKEQRNIFKHYYRANNVINSQETGSGIGLVVVKRIVELHNGTIKFRSKVNKGSTFTISFPGNKNAYSEKEISYYNEDKQPGTNNIPLYTTDRESSETGTTSESKESILIVEDNSELSDYLSNKLSSDYNVKTSENGRIALDIINNKVPDIIISDIMMPEMDGIELCKELRKNINTSHIPIILLTAMTSVDNKIEGLESGANYFLEKPFDLNHLKACIKNVITSKYRLQNKVYSFNNVSDEKILSNTDKNLIDKVTEKLSENISNSEFSIEDLSAEMAMSRPVLYRKIKALTGKSPKDYFVAFRMEKAKELLIKGELNINEIAYDIGFSNPKYFSTAFKKYFGKSPSKFLG